MVNIEHLLDENYDSGGFLDLWAPSFLNRVSSSSNRLANQIAPPMPNTKPMAER